MQQVKRCMHYHDNRASIRIGLIQLKVNLFYSINLHKIVLYNSILNMCLLMLHKVTNDVNKIMLWNNAKQNTQISIIIAAADMMPLVVLLYASGRFYLEQV